MSTQQYSPRKPSQNSIQFDVKCETNFGQEVRICGNSMELGNWNPLLGHRLVTDNKLYPYWKSFIPLIIKNLNKIEYKACIISNNRITWQRNVANRQIQCQRPSQIKFTFNQPKQVISQRLITQITCKQGTLDILQEMDDSETSSIQFKSNYPLENYFLPQGRNSLELSRGLSGSESSNLFSPGQQLMGSDEFEQFQQDGFGAQYGAMITPPPFKLQARRTQVYTHSNDYRQLFSTQDFLQRRGDHSRSHSGQKSQSGSQKGNQQPASPFIIHVPSIDNMGPKIIKQQRPSYQLKKIFNNGNQIEDDQKSTSTIMEFDTENEYLTTRDNDVVIEKQVPSYDDV